MQTLIQVICTKGRSLRDAIGDDDRTLTKFGLYVVEQKRIGRKRGWSKLHSSRDGAYGAINVQWDRAATVLVCRVVTRGEVPSIIMGDFVSYLFSRFLRRIHSLNIIP